MQMYLSTVMSSEKGSYFSSRTNPGWRERVEEVKEGEKMEFMAVTGFQWWGEGWSGHGFECFVVGGRSSLGGLSVVGLNQNVCSPVYACMIELESSEAANVVYNVVEEV